MTSVGWNVLIWGVFFGVLLVSGVLFGIFGYKKGTWHALISLGTTVVSFGCSLLLSHGIAIAVTPWLAQKHLSFEGAAVPLGDAFVDIITSGILKSIVTLILFVLLMPVLTAVFKCIGNCIQKDRLVTDTKQHRIGGLGVRIVDAVVFTVMFLFPVYGTVCAYAQTAGTIQTVGTLVADTIENDIVLTDFMDADLQKDMMQNMEFPAVTRMSEKASPSSSKKDNPVLQTIYKHPLVSLASCKPMRVVYAPIHTVSVYDQPIQLNEIVLDIGECIAQIELLIDTETPPTQQQQEKMLWILQNKLIKTDWFYALYSQSITQAKESMQNTPYDTAFSRQVCDALQVSQEQFDEITVPLLDFAEYLVTSQVLNQFAESRGDVTVLQKNDFYMQLANVLNANESITALKGLLLQNAIQYTFADQPEAVQLLEKRISFQPLTDKTQLEKEGQAIVSGMLDASLQQRISYRNGVQITIQGSKIAVLETLARHPKFGMSAINEIAQKTDLSEFLCVPAKWREENMEQQLLIALKTSANAPVGKRPFLVEVAKYVYRLLHT
jgi:hypothetical protein